MQLPLGCPADSAVYGHGAENVDATGFFSPVRGTGTAAPWHPGGMVQREYVRRLPSVSSHPCSGRNSKEYEKQYANIAVNDDSKNGLTSTTVKDGNGVSYKKSIQDAITNFEKNAKYFEADETYSVKLLTASQNVYKVVSGGAPTYAEFIPDYNGGGTFGRTIDYSYWKDKLTYSEETSKMLRANAEELLNASVISPTPIA